MSSRTGTWACGSVPTTAGGRPAPVLVVEVLSERTAEERDLGSKIGLYAQLGVAEYILLDQWGDWLPQRLLLKSACNRAARTATSRTPMAA